MLSQTMSAPQSGWRREEGGRVKNLQNLLTIIVVQNCRQEGEVKFLQNVLMSFAKTLQIVIAKYNLLRSKLSIFSKEIQIGMSAVTMYICNGLYIIQNLPMI